MPIRPLGNERRVLKFQGEQFERIYAAPDIPWRKRPPAGVFNLSAELLQQAKLSGPRTSTGPCVDRFSGTYLVWNLFLIRDDTVYTPYCRPGAAREYMDSVMRYEHIACATGILREGDHYAILESRLRNAERVSGPVLFGNGLEHDNWGAFLLETLPAAFHFLNNRDRYHRFFVHLVHDNMRALLRYAGLRDEEIVEQDCAKTYFFEDVHVMRRPYRDVFVSVHDHSLYLRLKESVLRGKPCSEHRAIYVSRRGGSPNAAVRPLLNEGKLVKRLQSAGVFIIDPAAMSVEAQIATFAGATHVIGLGGAGMFNVVFCRQGAKVLDIESSTRFLEAHSNIFSSCGLEYSLMVGREDPDDPADIHKRWWLDLPRAMPEVRRFLAS